ncbi:hypothetical protein B0I03_10738 [Flavobacterium aquaticum]|uniref:Secreted protein n=1 Tax=Flavobacterium aquaticum TaxID=1236486 RepID=A0A327YRA8_9FLAO|nr:hypothetical protein [Flavobacterium aquaticum]RAK20619.1 hypothetical protein B0I03_10738 [Flavobacterium aquaticum]
MKNRILILIFLLQVTTILAQKENPFKSAKLKLNWDEPSKVETNQNTISLPYKSIFDKNDDYLKRYSILNQKKGEESVMVQKSEFKNPGDEVKEKLNKETQQGSWENVFFGKFKVSTSVLKIRTRDHMDPDGDKVRIILNDVTVVNVINLDSDFKTSYIDLREGDNLMDIVALNQGLSGPNTATFAIYDENDNLITTNDWNLNTGVAAKFIIEYVKPIDKK